MRKTTLKRTSRGYVRNLGSLPQGGQPKFYLGHDKEVANVRLSRIAILWKRVEEEAQRRRIAAKWDDDMLMAAKALASGETPTLKKRDFEPEDKYFSRLSELSRELGVTIESSDPFLFEAGRSFLINEIETTRSQLAKAIGSPTATGQTLHEALRAYQQWIKNEYKDPADGLLSDNGKKKYDQIKTIRTYVSNKDLGALDYHGCDEVFGIFRRRPVSKRYGKPMARKSCTNYIGELSRFFRWLHLSSAFNWRKPDDFELISRSPKEIDDDIEHESSDTPVWTVDQLKILNEYALPLERIFFLLGLNCSYGADQSGRLRVGHLHLSDGKLSYIRRIRRKKKTRSMHLLWKQTVEGLRWALNKREAQEFESDFVLLTDTGRPYWNKTKGGNRTQAIPNLWNRLLDRVQKDYPQFPRLPFNSLRDTSANFVRRLGGEETASLHLAHKHQSRDENLNRYTNPVRKKHFRVLRKVERKLQKVFEAAGDTPWVEPNKNYIGKARIKQINEMHSRGCKIAVIASELGISTATVYRHLSNHTDAAPSDKMASSSKV